MFDVQCSMFWLRRQPRCAVSPNYIRQSVGPDPGVGPWRCDADYKSAIRPSAAEPQPNRSAPVPGRSGVDEQPGWIHFNPAGRRCAAAAETATLRKILAARCGWCFAYSRLEFRHFPRASGWSSPRRGMKRAKGPAHTRLGQSPSYAAKTNLKRHRRGSFFRKPLAQDGRSASCQQTIETSLNG
jgi:hypothetical protein